MAFRFAVGSATGARSSSWRLWTWREDVYLLQRSSGKIDKFSFHKSGICRWAMIDDRPNGADRAILKWERAPIAPAGEGRASLLASLVIPTNHLSESRDDLGQKVSLIEPALPGKAVYFEFFVTRENKAEIECLFAQRGERHLIFAQLMPNGVHACASFHHVECGPVELQVPGKPEKPGQVFGDLAFPDVDTQGTGRPVRMMLMASNHLPPVVWELGGHKL